MSILSPHLREQKYGRRTVCFRLQDGVVVADSSKTEDVDTQPKKLVLRLADGSVSVVNAEGWTINCAPGDIITQVLLSPLKGKKKFLAGVINRTQRERERVLPMAELLNKARVSRAFLWWLSIALLVAGAVITDCGFFANEINAMLVSPLDALIAPLQPAADFVSRPLAAVLSWLPVPNWSSAASTMFGSLQDHGLIFFSALLLMVLILWYRSFRILTIPLFALCLFVLKTRIFGFDSAQAAVLYWYAPVIGTLVLTGAVNRLRDRWRLSARLTDICKSLMAQPIPQSMIKKPPITSEEPAEATTPEPKESEDQKTAAAKPHGNGVSKTLNGGGSSEGHIPPAVTTSAPPAVSPPAIEATPPS